LHPQPVVSHDNKPFSGYRRHQVQAARLASEVGLPGRSTMADVI
jgi:hypothetical protein